jgi:predicted TIM-barrel fold metal-dependent hydrolase
MIDIHTHVLPQYVPLAVEQMDRCGVDAAGLLCWHDGFGEGLQRYVEAIRPHPGRFLLFGNIDWSRINEPGFGEMAAEQLRKDAPFLAGVKVYKALGLTYRKRDGSLWQANDPALDLIWQTAGDLGLPVLIHAADPVYFWQPLNEANFWNGVLSGEYAWWSYYRKNLPSAEELLAERDELFARFPQTTFIAPHLGSHCHALDTAAEALERYPNLYYDISARIPIMGKSPRRVRHAREFLLEFQERILFGTDMIYDDTNLPTGMQAQCLFQPFELPLKEGMTAEQSYLESSVEFFNYHIEFLTTDHVIVDPPSRRTKAPLITHGANLPADVVNKFCDLNIKKLFRGLK